MVISGMYRLYRLCIDFSGLFLKIYTRQTREYQYFYIKCIDCIDFFRKGYRNSFNTFVISCAKRIFLVIIIPFPL